MSEYNLPCVECGKVDLCHAISGMCMLCAERFKERPLEVRA